ncbi:MAG: ABC transporter permease [Chloroflexota bacterium]|nr:ABC transporter permease [Chloroflexota bacterium]
MSTFVGKVNPVIVKELRGRMRGPRAAAILTLYLSVLSAVTLLVYWFTGATVNYSGPGASQVGKLLFGTLVVFQTALVTLLAPAFTSGSITQEREQKTYDLLMTTLLPARSVVLGKLGSALLYVVLLIVAVAPLESLAFIFGGVSPEEVVLSQVVMLMAALLFASIGIFWSSVMRSSLASNVLTYGTILFQLVALPMIYWLVVTVLQASYNRGPVAGPPFSATPEFYTLSGLVLSSNPLVAMGLSEALLIKGDPLFIYNSTTILNGHSLLVVSPWLIFCLEALLCSVLLVSLAIRRLGSVRHR